MPLCAVAGFSLATLSSEAGSLVYLSQARSVSASGMSFPDPFSVEMTAPDMEFWNASVQGSGHDWDGASISRASASQQSSLRSDGIRFQGYCEGYDSYCFAGGGHGFGGAFVDVQFLLQGGPQTIHILGELSGFYGYNSWGEIRLTRVGDVDETLMVRLHWDTRPWDATLVLQEGTYRLAVWFREGWGGSGCGGGYGTFDVRLLVPALACRADLDGNGVVEAADIGSLLVSFGACQGCAADLDGTGEVDGGDLAEVLLAFGDCP